ncbi:unnamed protein product [Ectocarpus sp. CCAP 1310/34]|nr:unnamed protein product [Ectocarpus sp. CCAP 1310/34]
MGRSLPVNLTHSSAYLTDKPYDVQLGVLRWIRGLLSEVVDNAVSQLSTTAAGSIHNVEPETQGDDDDDVACGRSAAREVGGSIPQKDEGVDGSEALNLKSTAALLDECVGAATTGSRGDGGSSSTGNGRKRPRTSTPLDRRDVFVPGSVVECFHPDDGLWYPATITAVIAQPPIEAPAVKAHPEAVAPPSDSLLATAAPTTLTAKHGEGGPTSPAKATPAAAGGEAEDGGVHSFVMVHSLAAAAAAPPAAADPTSLGKGEESEECAGQQQAQQQQQQQQKLLDVTFLGYGNQSRVPVDWAREIVTPEVLEWCKENGIVAASEGGFVEKPCDAKEEGALTTAGAGDNNTVAVTEVWAETPDPAVNNSTIPTSVSREVGGSDSQHPAAAGGGSGATGGGGKRSKQQPRKKSKKSNKKSGRHHGKGGGGRHAGTQGEEEERFLMRCASRSKSPYPHVSNKYWGQRYRYFSRFDEGVTMDEEGWYSVTPEAIARHIAERVCCDVVVDPFVGCGGNAVQFALVAHLVFAVDIDPVKLEHARRNAAIYGVEDRIEFILGDAMKVLPTLKADAVFLSPPWGGPSYQGSKTFDLDSMIPPPLSALDMFRAAREVTPNIVFFLPRNVDPYQVARLPAAAAAIPRGGARAGITEEQRGVDLQAIDDTCELEKHFLNGKLKTTTAYFGEDIAISSGNTAAAAAAAAAEAGRNSDQSHGPVGTIGGAAATETPAEVGAALEVATAKNSSELYGVNNSRVAATWSGRHVRFSEEDDGEGEEGGDVAEVRNNDSTNGGQERENALYEAWMAT